MNLSEPMRRALVRRLAANAHTVDALTDRELISAAQARTGRLARYDLTLTDLGTSYAEWFSGLGYT